MVLLVVEAHWSCENDAVPHDLAMYRCNEHGDHDLQSYQCRQSRVRNG
jgi:hypothetical protein